jgi:hypothetical protein
MYFSANKHLKIVTFLCPPGRIYQVDNSSCVFFGIMVRLKRDQSSCHLTWALECLFPADYRRQNHADVIHWQNRRRSSSSQKMSGFWSHPDVVSLEL